MKSSTYYIFLFFLLSGGCKKFVEIDPPKTELINEVVFSSDATATAAMNGLYSQMISGSFSSGTTGSVTQLCGLSADELKLYSTVQVYQEFYNNNILPSNSTNNAALWGGPYNFIYAANAILEGLAASQTVSDAVKQQLKGEALFIRAFDHFYLVNMYGRVPYITSTEYTVNRLAKRMEVEEVYNNIITDLKEAKQLLQEAYITGERVRPNKWAAAALLARVYLYKKDYANAESEATAVINNTNTYSLLDNLDDVFLKNSKEAIWQLMSASTYYSTFEGYYFILTGKPTQVSMSDALYGSFETGDNRLAKWVGTFTSGATNYHYPYKYKIKSLGAELKEYSMVLRFAEQYLVRAEARAHLTKTAEAIDDVDAIRHRAGLPLIKDVNPAISPADLLKAIEQERRVELFTEWGHRWFDLKRTAGYNDPSKTRADEVLGPLKAASWQSTDIYFPIPLAQMQSDPNMTDDQNDGY